jgi:hypothetical protein
METKHHKAKTSQFLKEPHRTSTTNKQCITEKLKLPWSDLTAD